MQLRQTATEDAVSTAVVRRVGLLHAVKWKERFRETLGMKKRKPDGNPPIYPVKQTNLNTEHRLWKCAV